MKWRFLVIIPVAFLLLLLTGCPNPMLDTGGGEDPGGARRITGVDTVMGVIRHETGVLGPGALYEIWMPPAWNHCLVLYAHGYVNPQQDVALPGEVAGMLPYLLGRGFAVAQSSYSENGWAVKDGAIRIRQLRQYVAGAYGPLAKAFLVGASEGAMISIMLAEKNPELFSGALCIGGPLGGAEMEVSYIYNVRILFDCFFRDELAAVCSGTVPVDPEIRAIAVALREALGDGALDAHPDGSPLLSADGLGFAGAVVPLIMALFQVSPAEAVQLSMTQIDGTDFLDWSLPMPPSTESLLELAATVAGGLWYNIYGTEDMLSRTHGHVPVDNAGVVYTVPGLGELTSIERLASRPDARSYLEHWYQPTGKVSIPVVILHTARDPIVPFAHSERYMAMASASGGPVLPILIPEFGHCQILSAVSHPPWFEDDTLAFGGYLVGAFEVLAPPGMP